MVIMNILMGSKIDVEKRGDSPRGTQESFGLQRNYRALSHLWWHHQGHSSLWENYIYKEIISSSLVSW